MPENNQIGNIEEKNIRGRAILVYVFSLFQVLQLLPKDIYLGAS